MVPPACETLLEPVFLATGLGKMAINASGELGIVLDPARLRFKHLFGLLLHRMRVAKPLVELLVDPAGFHFRSSIGGADPRTEEKLDAVRLSCQPTRPPRVPRRGA